MMLGVSDGEDSSSDMGAVSAVETEESEDVLGVLAILVLSQCLFAGKTTVYILGTFS